MKLSEARECYYSHSASASNVARQAAFAGIAVVWIFNQPKPGAPVALPGDLVAVLLLLAAALLLDLLQYTFAALIWGYYARRKEKELRHRFHEDPMIEPPPQLNWPGIGFFWAKLLALIAGYGLLGVFIAGRL